MKVTAQSRKSRGITDDTFLEESVCKSGFKSTNNVERIPDVTIVFGGGIIFCVFKKVHH